MKGNIRLGGALAIGIAVIAGAIYLRGEKEPVQAGAVVVAEAPPREYIEAKDSDGDGVSDWEEELGMRVVESIETPSSTASAPAEYQEPTTLTDKFARSFFEDFVTSKSNDLIPKTQEEFLQASIAAIEGSTQAALITRRDITVVDDSDAAIRDYGNRVAAIVTSYTVPRENEGAILAEALEKNDPEILNRLRPLREGYEYLVAETRKVPTPEALITQQLNLLNTYQAILTDIVAMEQAFTDPLYTLARMKRYEDDVAGMLVVFQSIAATFTSRGVSYANDESGSFFYLFGS